MANSMAGYLCRHIELLKRMYQKPCPTLPYQAQGLVAQMDKALFLN